MVRGHEIFQNCVCVLSVFSQQKTSQCLGTSAVLSFNYKDNTRYARFIQQKNSLSNKKIAYIIKKIIIFVALLNFIFHHTNIP